jgi:integrase
MLFGQRQGEAMGRDVLGLLRAEGWQQSIRVLKAFYQWGNEKFQGLSRDPTIGIAHVPARPPGVRIRPRDGRIYEALLHTRTLTLRNRCILMLLASGLGPNEVAALRVESFDVGLRVIRGGYGLRRTVPLSEATAGHLSRWLSVRPTRSLYLFPGPTSQRPISSSAVRAVVHRAAAVTFPLPAQGALRRRIYPLGFRHLFVIRSLAARVPPMCLRDLTGIDRFSRLTPYLGDEARSQRAHKELTRMTRRWRGWI